MTTSRLKLRSISVIVLALLLGPIVGLSYLWLVQIVLPGSAAADPSRAAAAWLLYIALGGAMCLAVEAIVVAPILIGFQRYRWKWLNSVAAAAIGFGLGFASWFVASVISGQDEAGWLKLAAKSLNPGVVGLIAAIVFRLIAVRRSPNG
jgi:type IV secretory pathway VirB2 component (pilin)